MITTHLPATLVLSPTLGRRTNLPWPDYYNPVDGDDVPVPHFGTVLQSLDQFNSIAEKLRSGGVRFIIEPTLRFKDTPGEQWTMFVKDPSGNNLEFKYVTRPELLFAKFVK